MYAALKDPAHRRPGPAPRRRSVQGRGGDPYAAGRRDRRRRRLGAQPVRQQLPRPGRPPGHGRGRPAGAGPVGLRDGLGPLHLRHHRDPQGAGAPAGRFPGHRRRDPLRLLLRRQRRSVRDPARSGGRGHLRRAQPREHHRRRTPVQGRPLPLPQPGHGRSGGPAGRGAGRAAPADRHRRGVLDGRLRRAAGPDRRPGRALRRAGHGRRLARRRLRRADRGGYAGAVRRPGPGGHRHRHAGQGPRRGERRLHRGARRDRRDAAAAVPAVPVLQLGRPVDRRGRPGHAGPAGDLRRAARPAAGQHRLLPGRDDRPRVRHPGVRPRRSSR